MRYFCLSWNSIQWQKILSFSKAKSLQINLIFRLHKDWWKSEIFNILQSHLWAKCLDFCQNECWILPFCCYLIISGVQSVIVLTFCMFICSWWCVLVVLVLVIDLIEIGIAFWIQVDRLFSGMIENDEEK